MRIHSSLHRTVFFLASLCLLSQTGFTQVLAQDWPQLLGPNRNGQAPVVELQRQSWPEKLQPKWTVSLGTGYAGPAIADGKLLIAHRLDGQEMITAFDAETAARVWETKWDATYQPRINPDNGPRCVPTVADGHVVCYGAAGDLICVRLEDGELIWKRPLRSEYRADDGYFGAGSSPLVVEDKVIVCLGGREAGIVAVDLSSGKTLWESTDYDASYASPITLKIGGTTRVLVVTRYNTVLLNPEDGDVLGDIQFGSRGPTVNAATPIEILGRAEMDKTPNQTDKAARLLLTSSYQVGALVLDVFPNRLVEVRRDADLLSSQYNTPVVVGDRIVGINGREDLGVASLRCLDKSAKRQVWERSEFGTAHLIAIGKHVLALNLEGQLSLIDPSGNNYLQRKFTTLPAGTYRALPAVSGSRLYVRSSNGNSSILARYDL